MSSHLLHALAAPWRRRSRLVAAITVGMLALAIGAGTAVYAVVHAIVLAPVPGREPDRLVWMWNARIERDRAPFSIADLEDYRRGTVSLEDLAPFTNWTVNLTGSGDAERLEGVRVSPDYFTVIGTSVSLGRALVPLDVRQPGVVVLGDRLWRRRFGGDSSIVGRIVSLNGTGYVVVGVLPPDFVFPFRDAEIATVLLTADDPRGRDRGDNFLRVVARLKRGVTLAAARSDLDAIARRLQRQYPREDGKKTGVNLVPLGREIVGDARPLLLTLLTAVGLVFLVTCANLAALVLVAMLPRRRDFALRLALGASRRQVAGLVLVEVASLAALGGAAGAVVSTWCQRALVVLGGHALQQAALSTIDRGALLVAVAAASAAALLCGVAPAWEMSSVPLDAAHGDSRITSRSGRRTSRALVALQVAATTVLIGLTVAAIQGYARLQQIDPGFRGDQVLSAQLTLPPARYASVPALREYADRLAARLAALPGVERAASVSLLPFSGLLSTTDFRILGRPDPPPDEVPQAHFRIVTPGYFAAMRIPIRAGREFTDADREHSRLVAVVSQTFVDRHFGRGSAVGAFVKVDLDPGPRELVGVVGDVKQAAIDGPPTADLYVPLRQMPPSQAPYEAARMGWVVRTPADPMSLADAVRREIRALDGEVAASGVLPMRDIQARATAPRRFNVFLLAAFGAAAMLLAGAGVYAAAAFSASARTRELSLRRAFGAGSAEVVRLIARSELAAVAAGVVLGGVILLGSGAVQWTAVAVPAAAFAAVGAWACAASARRVLRFELAEMLRS